MKSTGTKNQPHPRKPAPVIAESAIDPQAKVNGLGVECRGLDAWRFNLGLELSAMADTTAVIGGAVLDWRDLADMLDELATLRLTPNTRKDG